MSFNLPPTAPCYALFRNNTSPSITRASRYNEADKRTQDRCVFCLETIVVNIMAKERVMRGQCRSNSITPRPKLPSPLLSLSFTAANPVCPYTLLSVVNGHRRELARQPASKGIRWSFVEEGDLWVGNIRCRLSERGTMARREREKKQRRSCWPRVDRSTIVVDGSSTEGNTTAAPPFHTIVFIVFRQLRILRRVTTERVCGGLPGRRANGRKGTIKRGRASFRALNGGKGGNFLVIVLPAPNGLSLVRRSGVDDGLRTLWSTFREH